MTKWYRLPNQNCLTGSYTYTYTTGSDERFEVGSRTSIDALEEAGDMRQCHQISGPIPARFGCTPCVRPLVSGTYSDSKIHARR